MPYLGFLGRERDNGPAPRRRPVLKCETPYPPLDSEEPDGCNVSSGFLLVETVPGRETQVLELLARVPGITHRHVLFPAAIAVKLEASRDAFESTSTQLRALEGVTGTRVYRAKNV